MDIRETILYILNLLEKLKKETENLSMPIEELITYENMGQTLISRSECYILIQHLENQILRLESHLDVVKDRLEMAEKCLNSGFEEIDDSTDLSLHYFDLTKKIIKSQLNNLKVDKSEK